MFPSLEIGCGTLWLLRGRQWSRIIAGNEYTWWYRCILAEYGSEKVSQDHVVLVESFLHVSIIN